MLLVCVTNLQLEQFGVPASMVVLRELSAWLGLGTVRGQRASVLARSLQSRQMLKRPFLTLKSGSLGGVWQAPRGWRHQSKRCGRGGATTAGMWASKPGVPQPMRQQARRQEQPRVPAAGHSDSSSSGRGDRASAAHLVRPSKSQVSIALHNCLSLNRSPRAPSPNSNSRFSAGMGGSRRPAAPAKPISCPCPRPRWQGSHHPCRSLLTIQAHSSCLRRRQWVLLKAGGGFREFVENSQNYSPRFSSPKEGWRCSAGNDCSDRRCRNRL